MKRYSTNNWDSTRYGVFFMVSLPCALGLPACCASMRRSALHLRIVGGPAGPMPSVPPSFCWCDTCFISTSQINFGIVGYHKHS